MRVAFGQILTFEQRPPKASAFRTVNTRGPIPFVIRGDPGPIPRTGVLSLVEHANGGLGGTRLGEAVEPLRASGQCKETAGGVCT